MSQLSRDELIHLFILLPSLIVVKIVQKLFQLTLFYVRFLARHLNFEAAHNLITCATLCYLVIGVLSKGLLCVWLDQVVVLKLLPVDLEDLPGDLLNSV